MRKQPCVLKHITDAAPVDRDGNAPRRVGEDLAVDDNPGRLRLDNPAIALMTVVLPDPDAPKMAVNRPRLSKTTSRSKLPMWCWMLTAMLMRGRSAG